MKLRQKLAMVLAATMIVTAVPVTTMAKSINETTKVLTVEKDKNIGSWTTTTTAGTAVNVTGFDGATLKITPVDGLSQHDEFYLVLTNAEWATEAELQAAIDSTATTFEVKRNSKTELQINVKANVPASSAAADVLHFPVLAKATGGDVTVEIVSEKTTLTGEKVLVATTPESGVKGSVTVGDAKTFYTTGKLAAITVEETVAGSFNGLNKSGNLEAIDATKENKGYIKLTIDHSDFEFVATGAVEEIQIGKDKIDAYKTTVTQKGTRGLAGVATTANAYVEKGDAQVMYIELPENTNAKSKGVVEFTDIAVDSTTRKPETGELKVDIEGPSTTKLDNQKMANVNEYGVKLSAKDDKTVEVQAGRTGKVTFTLEELVEDSMANGTARTVEFVLDKGHFAEATVDANGKVQKPAVSAIEIGKIKHGDTENPSTVQIIEGIYDEDKNLIGFEAKLAAGSAVDKFTFEDVVVHVPVQAEGTVTLTAEGRAIDEAQETEIVTIKETVAVEKQAMTVKVGLKEQVGGKLVIEEAAAGMFAKGKEIVIDVEADADITFNGEPEVEVEGDLQLGDVQYNKTTGQLKIEVKRASKEASTITIKDFSVKVDRTVPEGSYDVVVSGSAIGTCGTLTVEDFFIVGTPNTEDLNNTTKEVTSIFTIGATKYTVNGVENEMDAPAFISETGRTMVPVRYLGNAFGVKPENIIFSNGTVTMLAGTRTIQVTAGSDIAYLNGAAIKMDTPVIIKDGRTYGSASQIGALLGVTAGWNQELQTATFNNKAE